MEQFKKTVISAEEEKEIEKHLQFIDHLTKESIKHGYRTVIGGGYAVDGAIGLITRPHADVNIQLYGNDVMTPKLFETRILVGKYAGMRVKDRGRSEFYHVFLNPDLSAEICYIQVATKPFSDTKIVIKSDGKYDEEHDFETKMIVLNGIRYEIQNPVIELAYKLYKREHRGDKKRVKHEQDIHNLRLITDPYDVQERLNKMIKHTLR